MTFRRLNNRRHGEQEQVGRLKEALEVRLESSGRSPFVTLNDS